MSKWKEFFYKLRHIEKCDFSRYAILYLYGGLYCDLDMICLRPIEPLLRKRELGLVFEPVEHQEQMDQGRRRIANGFLFSTPRHWIWPALMDFIVQGYVKGGSVLQNTSTMAIPKFAKKYNLTLSSFIETCFIFPITNRQTITRECSHDVLETTAYCYTAWNDGTGWGQELEDHSNNSPSVETKEIANTRTGKRYSLLFGWKLYQLLVGGLKF